MTCQGKPASQPRNCIFDIQCLIQDIIITHTVSPRLMQHLFTEDTFMENVPNV